MQRMRSVIVKLGPVMIFLIVTGVCWPARGDLIRPKTRARIPTLRATSWDLRRTPLIRARRLAPFR